jgi:hypothetical protein
VQAARKYVTPLTVLAEASHLGRRVVVQPTGNLRVVVARQLKQAQRGILVPHQEQPEEDDQSYEAAAHNKTRSFQTD